MSDTNGNGRTAAMILKIALGLLVTIALYLFTCWGNTVESHTGRIGRLEGHVTNVKQNATWAVSDIKDLKADVKELLQKMTRVETLLEKRGNACVDSDIPAFEDFGGLVLKSKSSKEREGGTD